MPNQDDTDLQTIVNRVRRLSAREAIKELKARYARGADAVFNNPGQQSAIALADLFTEDGVLDLGPFGRFEGRTALLNGFENVLPQATKWSAHYIVSPLIELQSEHQATGNWYYLIQMVPADPPDSGVIPVYGFYDDKYQKTPDGWKIKETIAGFSTPPS